MRRTIMAVGCSAAWALGVTEPPMPSWDEERRELMIEEGWIAGGTLLDFDAPPEEEKPDTAALEALEPATEDMQTGEEDGDIVSEEYLAEYFAAKPGGYLVDPQGLVSTRMRKDLEAFLKRHSWESSIDMVVYVFGEDQEIPGDVREEEVVERLYSVGKPAVIVYYYLGAPQRSAAYLSPIITDAVSAAEQRRAMQSSVFRAFDHTDPFEQLEAFLVQMSIRIYWMERMAEGTADETMESIPEGSEARAFTKKKELPPEPDAPLPSWVRFSAAAVAAAGGFLLFLWSAYMWFRVRSRVLFPEFEVEPRLGAGHAAGVGAVISFSSASVPPARQRDQVPDYMRRA